MPQGQKIVSKSDLLVLHRPQHSRRPLIYVRVTVERGILTVQKSSRRCSIRPSSVTGEYDLQLVWVTNNCDVLDGNVRYSFEVITPEKCYIFQAETHRAKIDWMQALCIGASQCLQFRGSYRPASWSNLEDLQRWLSVREVEYEYKETEEYAGAKYTGKWHMGKPEGMGSMQWPDGHRYDGEFVKGKIEGTGTMMWFSDQSKTSYTGNWRRGRMDGHGEMSHRDGSVYRGWWRGGIRHGHGRMEYRTPAESLYTGDWENDRREGYGVFHNTLSGEHYLGMWKSDIYHGPAILLTDGGEEEERGSFHCGMFREGVKIDGTLSLTQLQHSSKWLGLFQQCSDHLQQMVSSSHADPAVTHRLTSTDEAYAQSQVERGEDEMRDIYRAYGATAGSAHKECLVCSMEGFKSASHPFGILVNHLTRCFNESYSGIAQHPHLLPHAIGELTSVTERLHQLIWRLCPTVIQSNRALHQSYRTRATRGGQSPVGSPSGMGVGESPGDHTWLYPILLPSITETLMTLYIAHWSGEDEKLSTTLKDLDEKPDNDLCELLELMSEYQCWKGKEDSRSFTELLWPAAETLSKLREYRSPLNKLLCIQETNAEVTKVYRRLHPERDSLLAYSHDEQGQLISSKLFSFVIVRSQQSVDFLSSEIHFISDFAGSVLHTKEYGYLLTELKDCYQQLSDLYVDEDEWI